MDSTNQMMSKTAGIGYHEFEFDQVNSLKNKLLTLEDKILDVAKNMNDQAQKITTTGNNKDEINELLKAKNKEVTDKLSKEIDKVKGEMDDHFTLQKNQNLKLQKDIANLKDQKRQLQDLLMALQRKIDDLELQVGIHENGIIEHTV